MSDLDQIYTNWVYTFTHPETDEVVLALVDKEDNERYILLRDVMREFLNDIEANCRYGEFQ